MVSYPYTLTPDDNGTLLVDFPDFPEAHTFGEDAQDAARRAVACLETVIGLYINERRALPPASAGKHVATLPTLAGLKVALYLGMRQEGIWKAGLAKRLDVHLPQVDRLLALKHQTRLDTLEAALAAVGRTVTIRVGGPGAARSTAPRVPARTAAAARLSARGPRAQPARRLDESPTRRRSR